MTEQPKPESHEGDAEFERVLRNLVSTPHKPHKPGKGVPSRQDGDQYPVVKAGDS